MNFIQEYALLIAVATPVAVIVAIQVWLVLSGERGTLLLPSQKRFPSVEIAEAAKARELIEEPSIARDTHEATPGKPAWLLVLERPVASGRRVAVKLVAEEKQVAEKAA